MPIYILFPLFASAVTGIVFMNFPPLTKEFMSLYNVEHGGLALLYSALFWSHAIFQIPAGFIVDKFGAFKILIISILLIIICNLCPLLKADSLTLSVTARFIMGIGTSLLFLSVIKVLVNIVPPNKIPLAQGLQGGLFSFGLLIPYLTFPFLGKQYLSFAFIIPAILLSILFVACFFIPKEKKNKELNNILSKRKLFSILKKIFKNKIIWIAGISHGLLYGSINNLGQWMPSIISDRSQNIITWASLATAIILIAGAISRILGSQFLKCISQEKLNIYTILSSGLLCLALAIPSNYIISIFIAIIIAISCGLSYGSIFSITNKAFPLYVATAVGFMNMIANLVSSLLTVLLGSSREITNSFSLGFSILGLLFIIFYFCIRKQTVLKNE